MSSAPTPSGVTPEERAARVRLRIRFSKVGKVRWTSHRDLARMWERAFRRVQLPLAYSEGFSPRPKVSFGLALPTGHESVAEYLDLEITSLEGVDLATLPARLSDALPVGVDAAAVAVLEPGTPSLQQDVIACNWRWQVPAPATAGTASEGATGGASASWLATRVAEVLAAPVLEITRSRKGTDVVEDIRPGLTALAVEQETPEGVWLTAELAAQPRAVRPADVLSAIGPGLEERHVRRTHQWIERHGARREPLPLGGDGDATEAPHALERAS